ncbi:MAG: hypothetical protein AB7I25_05470, partial [Vicinamibacterales bacterium]
ARGVTPIGEFSLVVGPPDAGSSVAVAPDPSRLALEFGELTQRSGFARRDAIAELARQYGVSTRAMYRQVDEALREAEKSGE